MCKIRYLVLLVLVLSMTFFETSNGRKGNHKKCVVNSTAHAEKYSRVFVFAGEVKALIFKKQPWPETFKELHEMAGRTNRSQVIQEGRRALDFFKTRFGLDVSHMVNDDQLYNGEDVPLGNYTFSALSVYLQEGPYRLIMESKAKGNKTRAHYYNNPPEVLEVWFGIVVHSEFNAGGTFNRTLYPGDLVGYGNYIIKTSKRCSMDGLTVLHFQGDPVGASGGKGVITHADYGTGSFQLSLVKYDDGLTRAVNVIRFP